VRGPSAKVIRAVRIAAGAAAVTRHSPPHERRRMGADQGNARPRSEGPQRITPTTPGLAPPGITIASNGTISGSGNTLGTYTVTVTATDTKGVSGTATFVWSVVQ
jgi:hypothetical protein